MPPSSNAFVPSTVGLICASYVVNDILKDIPVRRIKDKVITKPMEEMKEVLSSFP